MGRKGEEHALLEFPIHDVRKDFEFAVRMSSESCARIDPVLVEDTQVSEPHVIIISISENEKNRCQYVTSAFAVSGKTACNEEPTRQRRTYGMS